MSKSAAPDPLNPFGELTKMMEQFKLPGVDMAAITAAGRKEMEALVAANKAAFETLQELARKQGEIFTQAMQGAQQGFGALASGDTVKHQELARGAYEKAVAQMSELAEMARKAQADALAALTQRAQQSAQDIKKALQPK